MRRVAVIAAHPDDETIGLGAQLARFQQVHLIHITDGAPRHGRDAAALGFDSPKSYARARRLELLAAMQLASIGADRVGHAGFADQEASLDLAGLARRLADMIVSLRPSVVLTHAYEGGHPDHDATAFGVHAACALLGRNAPQIREFTSYHSANGEMRMFEFLPPGSLPPSSQTSPATLFLSAAERHLKRRMMDCFVTQQQMLRAFPVRIERLRDAPRYDFRLPPHAGTLFYDQFDWGMSGERWRTLARHALETLRLNSDL